MKNGKKFCRAMESNMIFNQLWSTEPCTFIIGEDSEYWYKDIHILDQEIIKDWTYWSRKHAEMNILKHRRRGVFIEPDMSMLLIHNKITKSNEIPNVISFDCKIQNDFKKISIDSMCLKMVQEMGIPKIYEGFAQQQELATKMDELVVHIELIPKSKSTFIPYRDDQVRKDFTWNAPKIQRKNRKGNNRKKSKRK